ncbi:uncharacterized protein EV154DRAFT_607906 [Mucor mucedo]|uniref:uncharacterized protein n=1 Tax=Mucor mucedo TaxID=29922 RepID=UPI00222052B0|nr:uncharacterized protein EV154DRAFT_607906 [Mucor mucedo]KAI7867773.1 hypothetical protein EV154DRAFT_607906 [Mucor mucedo]
MDAVSASPMQQETPAVHNDQRDLDERFPYLTEFRCEETEGLAHVYNNGVSSFDKNEISQPGYRELVRLINTVIGDHDQIMEEPCAKVSQGDIINALGKSKSTIRGYEKQESECQAPAITTTIMSVGYMLSQMLAETKKEGPYAV